MKQITVTDFKNIKDDKEIVLLDVRTEEEWEIANISGLLMPLDQIGKRYGELDKTKAIYCLCHHGVRSQHAQQFLVSMGFENVYNIIGGIDAWSHHVDPSISIY